MDNDLFFRIKTAFDFYINEQLKFYSMMNTNINQTNKSLHNTQFMNQIDMLYCCFEQYIKIQFLSHFNKNTIDNSDMQLLSNTIYYVIIYSWTQLIIEKIFYNDPIEYHKKNRIVQQEYVYLVEYLQDKEIQIKDFLKIYAKYLLDWFIDFT